ncbi:hypothetical protein D3C86_2253620 [compost metagenome]
MSVAEALAEILDFPLSGYGERELPKDKASQEKLRKMIQTYQKKRARTKILAKQVKLLGPG